MVPREAQMVVLRSTAADAAAADAEAVVDWHEIAAEDAIFRMTVQNLTRARIMLLERRRLQDVYTEGVGASA